MVLKRLVILLPVLAHSPFVPRGAKGSCVAFQSLGAALLKSRGPERARRSRESRSRRASRGEKAAHAFLPPPGIDFSTSGIRRCGCTVLAPSPSAAPLSGESVLGAFQCSLGTALTGVAVPRARVALTRVAAVAQVKGKALADPQPPTCRWLVSVVLVIVRSLIVIRVRSPPTITSRRRRLRRDSRSSGPLAALSAPSRPTFRRVSRTPRLTS